MTALNSRSILALMLVTLAALTAVRCQITFSRDWTGGKRSAPSDLAVDCAQFARICRHFIRELKTAMADQPAVENKRRPTRAGIEDLPPLYDEEK